LKKLGNLFRKISGSGRKSAAAPVVASLERSTAQNRQKKITTQNASPSRAGRNRPKEDRTHSEHSRRSTPPGGPKLHPRATRGAGSRPEVVREAWDPTAFKVSPVEGEMRFHDLDLPLELMHAIHDLGFKYCTPIQASMLPRTLSGADATGRAQTGTGKTAAFLITILSNFSRKPLPGQKKGTPRALIVAPTRELVLQIEKDAKSLAKYMACTVVAIFGGMDYRKQQHLLGSGNVDIVVATPGRLLDFKGKRNIDLSKVEVLVVDEADRMLDMGFIPDVRRIIESTPMKGTRQTLFFSATLTPEVKRLAASWTRNPLEVDVTPAREITLSAIDQVVYITTDAEKFALLYNLITKRNLERVMVFANRRDETQFLKDLLDSRGIACGLLSGDVSQEQRVKTLEAFRNGRFKVLVATDVAARGLHIEGVSHVVNYSLPMDPQDYLHRIGRTGRAGASGTSVSFATETEAYEIPEIEKFIGRSLVAVHPEADLLAPLPALAEGISEPLKRRSHISMPGGRRGRPQSGGRGGGHKRTGGRRGLR